MEWEAHAPCAVQQRRGRGERDVGTVRRGGVQRRVRLAATTEHDAYMCTKSASRAALSLCSSSAPFDSSVCTSCGTLDDLASVKCRHRCSDCAYCGRIPIASWQTVRRRSRGSRDVAAMPMAGREMLGFKMMKVARYSCTARGPRRTGGEARRAVRPPRRLKRLISNMYNKTNRSTDHTDHPRYSCRQ